MKQPRLRADSFVLKARCKRVYRIRHRGGVTIFWTSGAQALRYLTAVRQQRLSAKDQGR